MSVATEGRILVTIVTFLSAFFILTMTIPSGLIASPQQGNLPEVPEYFESIDIHNFADIYNFTVTSGNFKHKFTLGGWNVMFDSITITENIFTQIYDAWWIFTWNYRHLEWFNSRGIKVSDPADKYLTFDALDDNYDAEDGTCKFTVKNYEVSFVVFFGFNTTKYSKPSEALLNDELECLFCINFDQVNTTFNAWNLIAGILFFQMPNVHPAINALIAIPIWVMIAYLIYILILKAIPFVGG